MRVVLFGTGSPLSVRAAEALARSSSLAAVVVPAAARGLAPSARRPLVRLSRRIGIPVEVFRREAGTDFAARLEAHSPELLCVASFPFRLGPEILGAATRGGVNVHFSLLPRHRGPDPLFWTYFCADLEAGVSVHWLDEGVDTGDLLAQERVPLARGRPARDLYAELAERGARLLSSGVEAIARGVAPRRPQDPSQATFEPSPRAGTWSIDWSAWSAERLWHVLRGLGGLRHDLLPVPHGEATAWSPVPHGRAPGAVERTRGGLLLYARDGIVEIAKAPLLARLRARLPRASRRRA